MHFTYPTYVVEPTVEFLAHEKGLVTISHTIVADGIEPNELGHKIAVKGSYIDKDGKVLKPTFTEDSVTFDSDPIGILFANVDVTYGNADGAIMYKGIVQGDYMDWGDQEWSVKLGEAVHAKLPYIDFTDKQGNLVTGIPAGSGGSSPSTVNFDLSKATGTLGIDKGGTGATSASGALDALLESQPLSVENGGTGKGTASEALDALLESQPLPITKGGTGASDKENALTNLGAQKAAE